jgi:hypothetical protein
MPGLLHLWWVDGGLTADLVFAAPDAMFLASLFQYLRSRGTSIRAG